MANSNFNELLMSARRKAQLSGRPLSQQETAGIAAGVADTASARLARSKGIEVAEEGLEVQREGIASTERSRSANLAEQKADRLEQQAAASRATKKDDRRELGTGVGAAIGAAIGSTVPGGILIGAQIGGTIGGTIINPLHRVERKIGRAIGTWLCTATKQHAGLTKEDRHTLDKFRDYADKFHPGWLEFYLRAGPVVVKAIEEKEGDRVAEFYELLKINMIKPVIKASDEGRHEKAYDMYRTTFIDLIDRYTPQYRDEALIVERVDRTLHIRRRHNG